MNIKQSMTTLFSILTLGLLSCSEETVIYTGQFKDQKYIVTSIETKGPSTNSINYELKLGNLTPVMIDPLSTNPGVPYSSEVFKGTS